MRAYQLNAYGKPGTHQLQEVDAPTAHADQVIIRNEAIGLNYPDLLMVQGMYQKRPEPPFVPGRDCAGIVVAVGPEVTDFTVGDKVVAQTFSGAFAEVVSAPVTRVFHRPDSVSAIEAAGGITVFNTAFVAVSIRAGVKAGDRVIVTGAAGGVGAAAVQVARNLGADVVAIVSSKAKAQHALASGANKALIIADRSEEGLKSFFKKEVRTAWGDDRGADVVVDTVGGTMFTAGLRALGFAGRLVVVGFASGDIPSAKTNYLLYNNLSVMGAPLDIHFDNALEQMRGGTDWWLKLMAEGKAVANVTKTIPFTELMQGLQDIHDQKVVGKIVVTLGSAG
ncbi:zinc-binding dehydrogenase [Celeribacter halophilus]|uniref:zinc-binding dehydrogenase n=1 Tax=Celeribacter halophilus TaxID=576117 RepID=UPI001C09624E|nr:zinc-binding dehydrogenase [Celeribacter halophilus]MBU2891386.1 zinc-binding dehydrogenase [Celeribacter halophilus]MDO6512402.1 zinc-binding dehydrogenase [Celeribacter halophilus]